jgi:hypothetical protein
MAEVVLRLLAEELEWHVVMHGAGESYLRRLEALATHGG